MSVFLASGSAALCLKRTRASFFSLHDPAVEATHSPNVTTFACLLPQEHVVVKDTSYSRTLVFTSVVLWVVVAAWGKSRKGGRAVCEVVVLLNLQHEVLESAQESVVVACWPLPRML